MTIAGKKRIGQVTHRTTPAAKVEGNVALIWNPKPDITVHELAVLMPYVLGRFPFNLDVYNRIPAAQKHFDKRSSPVV